MDVIQRVVWHSDREPAPFPVWGLSLAPRALLLESRSRVTAALRIRLQARPPPQWTHRGKDVIQWGEAVKQCSLFTLSSVIRLCEVPVINPHSPRWHPQMQGSTLTDLPEVKFYSLTYKWPITSFFVKRTNWEMTRNGMRERGEGGDMQQVATGQNLTWLLFIGILSQKTKRRRRVPSRSLRHFRKRRVC